MSNAYNLWHWFNAIKICAVHHLRFNAEQRKYLKEEIDDLYRQATGKPICPGWYIGAL
jgi:hypothetical protein